MEVKIYTTTDESSLNEKKKSLLLRRSRKLRYCTNFLGELMASCRSEGLRTNKDHVIQAGDEGKGGWSLTEQPGGHL